jgi:hypothetical protein
VACNAVDPYAAAGHVPAGLDLDELTERGRAEADAVMVLGAAGITSN